MTLNDLLRNGRNIVQDLSSGDIPLVDKDGNELKFDLTLGHTSEGKLVCVMCPDLTKLIM